MVKALAFTRSIEAPALETARRAIVLGCALALILAGRALPF